MINSVKRTATRRSTAEELSVKELSVSTFAFLSADYKVGNALHKSSFGRFSDHFCLFRVDFL